MVWFLLFIILVVSYVLYKYFLPEAIPILRAFVVFLSMSFILGCTLYAVYMYIPGADKVLSDSSGNFNLTVISVFIAGLSFFAGLQERERLRQLDLKRDKYIELEEALYQFRDEWGVIVNSLRTLHEKVQDIREWGSQRYNWLYSDEKQSLEALPPYIQEAINYAFDNILRILNVNSEWDEMLKRYNQILNETLPLALGEKLRRVGNVLMFMDVDIDDIRVFDKAKNQLYLIKDKYNEKLKKYLIAGQKEAIFEHDPEELEGLSHKAFQSLDKCYKELNEDITVVQKELDEKISDILVKCRKKMLK